MLAQRITVRNKFSDFEVNQLLHALAEQLSSLELLHLRPSSILVIKKQVSLLAGAGTAEQQLQLLVKSQVVDKYMSPELQQLVKCSASVLDVDLSKVQVFSLGIILMQLLLLREEHDLEHRQAAEIGNELFQELVSDMLITAPDSRLELCSISARLYSFKSHSQFELEFDFRRGQVLGHGAFGVVKKCFSNIDK